LLSWTRGQAARPGAPARGPPRRRLTRAARAQANNMPGHNTSLFILGVMILWFGWYGFNPGSQQGITNGQSQAVATAAIATTIAAGSGGFSALVTRAIVSKVTTGARARAARQRLRMLLHAVVAPEARAGRRLPALRAALAHGLGAARPDGRRRGAGVMVYDVMVMGNGVLAGLVAITAPCAVVWPWAAIIIGAVAGIIYTFASMVSIMARVRAHARRASAGVARTADQRSPKRTPKGTCV
jgi:Amt family ammonium transporter